MKGSEIFNDWAIPRRLHDVLALNIETGDQIPAAIHFYHDREYGSTFGERGLAILRILLPAFKSGVATHQRLAAHRSQLSNVFDAAMEGYALFDVGGRQIHENQALERVLAAEPERERLRASMRALAAGFAALACRNRPRVAPCVTDIAPGTFREIQTARGRYRMRATLVSPGLLASDACVLIASEVPERRPLSDEKLRERYMLTTREVEVARLLADGLSTRELSAALRVSSHTARHHTENVLRKLRVRRRGEVWRRLWGG